MLYDKTSEPIMVRTIEHRHVYKNEGVRWSLNVPYTTIDIMAKTVATEVRGLIHPVVTEFTHIPDHRQRIVDTRTLKNKIYDAIPDILETIKHKTTQSTIFINNCPGIRLKRP